MHNSRVYYILYGNVVKLGDCLRYQAFNDPYIGKFFTGMCPNGGKMLISALTFRTIHILWNGKMLPCFYGLQETVLQKSWILYKFYFYLTKSMNFFNFQPFKPFSCCWNVAAMAKIICSLGQNVDMHLKLKIS